MSATSHTNWFWSDWLGDSEVRQLTAEERGLWIDLLGLAASGNPKGYVTDASGCPLSASYIGRVANINDADRVEHLMAQIIAKGVASKDADGRLYNRRMVRGNFADNLLTAKKVLLSAKRSEAGKRGAAKTNLLLASRRQTQLKINENPDLPTATGSTNERQFAVRQKSAICRPLGARVLSKKEDNSSFGSSSEHQPLSREESGREPIEPLGPEGGSLATALLGSALRSPPSEEKQSSDIDQRWQATPEPMPISSSLVRIELARYLGRPVSDTEVEDYMAKRKAANGQT
jgi:hypothetical protein